MHTPWGDDIAFNLKCIYGSVGLALFYWFAPPKNKWVLAGILYFTYLAIAWYDHLCDCRQNLLKPTFLYGFYGALKPAEYRKHYADWKPQTKRLVGGVDLAVAAALLLGLPAFLRWRPGCGA